MYSSCQVGRNSAGEAIVLAGVSISRSWSAPLVLFSSSLASFPDLADQGLQHLAHATPKYSDKKPSLR